MLTCTYVKQRWLSDSLLAKCLTVFTNLSVTVSVCCLALGRCVYHSIFKVDETNDGEENPYTMFANYQNNEPKNGMDFSEKKTKKNNLWQIKQLHAITENTLPLVLKLPNTSPISLCSRLSNFKRESLEVLPTYLSVLSDIYCVSQFHHCVHFQVFQQLCQVTAGGNISCLLFCNKTF